MEPVGIFATVLAFVVVYGLIAALLWESNPDWGDRLAFWGFLGLMVFIIHALSIVY